MVDKTAEGARGESGRLGVPPSVARDLTARVLVVDDHDLVRDGYHRMLAREPDLEVVGEATNGREAVERCRELRPDLVLMDVRMPEMDGLEATRRIKGELPATGVLVVTTYDNPDYLLEAIESGAAGYVLKDAPRRRLVTAVRRTLNGESPLDQELAARLIRRLSERARHSPREAPAGGAALRPLADPLTRREAEVLGLMARGLTNPQIARKLVVAMPTAKTHVQNVIRKLGVSDRTQASVRAVALGLVDSEPS